MAQPTKKLSLMSLILLAIPDPDNFDLNIPEVALGGSASVEIRFHSNPEPDTIEWNLHDIGEPILVNVSASTRSTASFVNDRYTFESVTQVSPKY